MPMSIMCSRGCGYPLTVTDDVIKEAQALGVPINASHEAGLCPGTPGKDPSYNYRLRISVERAELVDGSTDGQPWTTLIKNGGDADGDALSQVFDRLTEILSKQWQKAQEMQYLAEE